MKRFLLFTLTNSLVVISIMAVLHVCGIEKLLLNSGATSEVIVGICVAWGLIGSFISLSLSRIIAKLTYRIELLEIGGPGDWVVREVSKLCIQSNIPLPEVGVYKSSEINAFATGPSERRSIIALSTGLLETLTKDQVRSVIAHEVTHIANGDMVTMALMQGIINSYVFIGARILSRLFAGKNTHGASAFVTMIFEIALGFLGLIVICWFSRTREYRADLGGAKLVGPLKMVDAIEAISIVQMKRSTFRLNCFTSFNLGGGSPVLKRLFSFHPSSVERISNLKGYSE